MFFESFDGSLSRTGEGRLGCEAPFPKEDYAKLRGEWLETAERARATKENAEAEKRPLPSAVAPCSRRLLEQPTLYPTVHQLT